MFIFNAETLQVHRQSQNKMWPRAILHINSLFVRGLFCVCVQVQKLINHVNENVSQGVWMVYCVAATFVGRDAFWELAFSAGSGVYMTRCLGFNLIY